MPIPLHKDCVRRLHDLVATGLKPIQVDHRQYLDYATTDGLRGLDAALPTSGSTKQELDRIFGEDERLRAFTTDWISRHLKENYTYQSEPKGELLSSLEGFAELGAVAEEIVADFCALPSRYVVSLPLPDLLATSLDQFASSADENKPSPRLTSIDEHFRTKYGSSTDAKEATPFSATLRGLFAAAEAPQMPDRGLCLQVGVEGFIDQYGTTLTAANAVDQARSFFGLGLATFLFNIGSPKRPPPSVRRAGTFS